ncbi:MAG TPA: ribonuclease HII [Myxococcota bacterium]|nr:ribonuclease HII [Myxococcota bacterium]
MSRPRAGDVGERSLEELRVCVAGLAPRQELRWLRALRRDARRGARALASELERRRVARIAELRRLARLFKLRRGLFRAGCRYVAGVDEVGVGPMAGPLVAAAVILPPKVFLPGLDDSKRLTPASRERLDGEIRRQALCVAVAEIPPDEVDRIDVLRASWLAMRTALEGLALRPDHVLVDAHRLAGLDVPHTSLPKGDARDGSIAAASIVAKVHRDARMRQLDERYPGYGFARHMGYCTREHRRALAALGPCEMHRRSFAPVAQLQLFT